MQIYVLIYMCIYLFLWMQGTCYNIEVWFKYVSDLLKIKINYQKYTYFILRKVIGFSGVCKKQNDTKNNLLNLINGIFVV